MSFLKLKSSSIIYVNCNSNIQQNKNNIMAEIIESTQNHIPSNGKTSAALTLGIIGTALGAINAGVGSSILGRRNYGWGRNNWDCNNGYDGWNRSNHNPDLVNVLSVSPTTFASLSPFGGYGNFDAYGSRSAGITNEELYLERRTYQDELAHEKEFYEGQMNVNEKLVNAFFDSYKRDVDNSFMLYKSQRDHDDILAKKIDEVDKKVDMMAAIRPYQDALINTKIDKAELLAQYNLDKRTCRMITGQVVLPTTPEITGYGSYYNFPYTNKQTNP